MMMSEFIEYTGFQPTANEYEQIEEAYYNFDGDKDAFCKAFVNNGGGLEICKARAKEIERLNSLILETEKQFKKDVAERDRRIEQLTAELDRELEWKPAANAGTNMEQICYEDLAHAGQRMTDDEAKAFIADKYGFFCQIPHKRQCTDILCKPADQCNQSCNSQNNTHLCVLLLYFLLFFVAFLRLSG